MAKTPLQVATSVLSPVAEATQPLWEICHCPFAHPGEKARRRDPRRYHYSGTVCPEYRRGGCSRDDACEYAHGVFECWLHPSRYRTEACKDGRNCKRKVCFFAHTPRQLRILPVTSSPSSNDMPCKKNLKQVLNHASKTNNNNNCCLFCHCGASSSASPTSTLFGMSHFSPPLSPSSSSSPPPSPLKPRNAVSPISRYSAVNVNPHHVVSYKDVFTELVNSLERLSFNEGSPVSGAKAPNFPWLDVSLNCEEQQQQQQNPFIVPSFGCEDQQQQNQFIFSPPSIQTPTNGKFCSNRFMGNDNNNKVVGGADVNGPDLAWVNELLM
uniref:C3H1-type domain-containing protein n=1 Tax=Glycine max TaxID=3847 RepID=A0A0R0ELP6_SOYBN